MVVCSSGLFRYLIGSDAGGGTLLEVRRREKVTHLERVERLVESTARISYE